jgi:bifunctional DNA-binding transcriptional regulator/antitoxin component of YhaV-PrlF toxin-antitoxin module
MANPEHRFRSVIEAARGPGAAVALIPPEVTEALGGLKQMRITGTLNGTPFRSSTMPYRGAFYLGVHKATRQAAGVDIGDEVELTVVRDDSPRVLELAPELEAAFAAEPELRARFDALSFSRRRELAEPVAEAKKPETRGARVERALERLRDSA